METLNPQGPCAEERNPVKTVKNTLLSWAQIAQCTRDRTKRLGNLRRMVSDLGRQTLLLLLCCSFAAGAESPERCTPSRFLEGPTISANVVDLDPLNQGKQVMVTRSPIYLSGTSKVLRVNRACEFAPDGVAPVSWSLFYTRPPDVFNPPSEEDISSTLSTPTEQSVDSPSTTFFRPYRRGTYRARIRGGNERLGFRTAEIVIEATIPELVCTCYIPGDCPRGQTCTFPSASCGGCQRQGKRDGVCATNWTPLTRHHLSRNEIARSMDLWFQAYIATAQQEEAGLPDLHLVKAALDVPLPAEAHRVIKETIFSVLDYTAGFDFFYPPTDCADYSEGCLGQFRIPSTPTGIKLLETVRKGFIETLRSGDLSRFEGDLKAFWGENPDYSPSHTGRCYPHGHVEYEQAHLTPFACQSDAFSRFLTQMLETTQAATAK